MKIMGVIDLTPKSERDFDFTVCLTTRAFLVSFCLPISPVSTITAWATRLKNMPIWTFHGTKDELAPIAETPTLVDEIKKSGGRNLKFTTLENRDHFILDMYESKQLYEWFLQHKRRTKPL